jgi:hypothetical protein
MALFKLNVYHSIFLTNWNCKNNFSGPTCTKLVEIIMILICDRFFTHIYVCGSIEKLSLAIYNVPSKLLRREKYNTYIQLTY